MPAAPASDTTSFWMLCGGVENLFRSYGRMKGSKLWECGGRLFLVVAFSTPAVAQTVEVMVP